MNNFTNFAIALLLCMTAVYITSASMSQVCTTTETTIQIDGKAQKTVKTSCEVVGYSAPELEGQIRSDTLH